MHCGVLRMLPHPRYRSLLPAAMTCAKVNEVQYWVFESFEDDAAQEKQLPPAYPTALSCNLVPISLENPVIPIYLSGHRPRSILL